MQIKPNRSLLEGVVQRIAPASDGIGAEIVLTVETCAAADGFADFVAAELGREITLFAAVPEDVEEGRRYAVTVALLGGPGGERAVIEAAVPRPRRGAARP